MTTPEQEKMTYWILTEIRGINPYKHGPDDRRGHIYAYGFLASYLANILKNDIILRRQFERHIKQLQQRK